MPATRLSSVPLCGGCAKPTEVKFLSSRLDEGDRSPCSRCGFGTYLVLGEAPAPKRCTQADHDAMKATVDLFKASTVNHQQWAGLLTAECSECSSTLALDVCPICTHPCAGGDHLPWDDGEAHFECVARLMVAGRRGKFVILAGKTTAREYSADALAAAQKAALS